MLSILLKKIRQWPPFSTKRLSTANSGQSSGSFVIIKGADEESLVEVYPVSRVLSALPQSDLVLVSCPIPPGKVESLPVSPYPARKDAPIQAHLVRREGSRETGWNHWMGDMWGKWEQGRVLGYRDFAGRETRVIFFFFNFFLELTFCLAGYLRFVGSVIFYAASDAWFERWANC